MKITRLQAENFKKLTAIDIRPGDGAVVPIRGRNAQGKSSTLDAIQAALGGKAVAPKKPVRTGEDDATIRLELDGGEVVVRRTFTEDGGGQIIVETGEGARFPSPQKMLDGLYASVAFDPLAFTRLEPEQQFAVLRKLVKLDVDIDALAAANKADYAERTIVNREVKERAAQLPSYRVQGIIPPALVDEDAIEQEIAAAGEHNVLIERRKANREEFGRTIERNREKAEGRREEARLIRERIARLEEDARLADQQAGEFDAAVAEQEKQLAEAEPLPEPQDAVALAASLREAREGNRRFHGAAHYAALETSLEQRRKDADALTERMEERDKQRAAALAAADMPVPGLSLGEGEVLFNDIPLDQASSAEQLRVSTAIGMAGNPKLRVMLVRDGSLLDDDGQRILAELAEANEFQLWVEAVDASGKVGIILEDGAVKDAPTPEPLAPKRRKKKTASEDGGEPEQGARPVDGQGDGKPVVGEPSPDPDRQREDKEERRTLARAAPVSLFDD